MINAVISDVHERYDKLVKVLKKYDSIVDTFYFHSDFMDSFDDLTYNTHMTVKWLRDNLGNPKYKFVWGNHDMHYEFPIDEMICSGFDKRKLVIWKDHIGFQHSKHFKLMHWVDGYLVTHAGLHPNQLHPIHGFTKEALAEMEEKCLYQLRYCSHVTPLIKCGRGRGGNALYGGVTWLDWNREFKPIPGLNQIVGHTPYNEVRTNNIEDEDPEKASINYCLDTHSNHIMLIEDGKIRIESVEDI